MHVDIQSCDFFNLNTRQIVKMIKSFYIFLQDEDDEDEDNEEEGGLSKSGKELKKLLGRTGGLNDSDAEDDDDDEDVSSVRFLIVVPCYVNNLCILFTLLCDP